MIDHAGGELGSHEVSADKTRTNLGGRRQHDFPDVFKRKTQQTPRSLALLHDDELVAAALDDPARLQIGNELRHVVVIGHDIPGFDSGRMNRKIDGNDDPVPVLLHVDRNVDLVVDRDRVCNDRDGERAGRRPSGKFVRRHAVSDPASRALVRPAAPAQCALPANV